MSDPNDGLTVHTARPMIYRCRKGHEWTVTSGVSSAGVYIKIGDDQHGPFCLRCLLDLLQREVGEAELVAPKEMT